MVARKLSELVYCTYSQNENRGEQKGGVFLFCSVLEAESTI